MRKIAGICARRKRLESRPAVLKSAVQAHGRNGRTMIGQKKTQSHRLIVTIVCIFVLAVCTALSSSFCIAVASLPFCLDCLDANKNQNATPQLHFSYHIICFVKLLGVPPWLSCTSNDRPRFSSTILVLDQQTISIHKLVHRNPTLDRPDARSKQRTCLDLLGSFLMGNCQIGKNKTRRCRNGSKQPTSGSQILPDCSRKNGIETYRIL